LGLFETSPEKVRFLLAALALQPVNEAMRERQEFIARASHQLRTPLSIIRTAVELGRAGLGVMSDEAWQTVVTQTQRMETLAARLTELAKAESRERRTDRATDVVAVAADVVAALRPVASLAGVALQLEAPPTQRIRVEPAETADMLAAVVENAIKFSPRGGTVVVRVRLDRTRSVVEVTDQGSGIAAEDLPHVAKPFFQGQSARGGYGLGLAIARAVAERCGGHLAIVSLPGQGTTVQLNLPGAPANLRSSDLSRGSLPTSETPLT
jgi:two-component system sensor histidine kinase BaeS